MARRAAMTGERAEEIASTALVFLAEDADRLKRFLALSGLSIADIRAEGSSRGFLAAVLAHVAADESLLLVFAESKDIAPDEIALAGQHLA